MKNDKRNGRRCRKRKKKRRDASTSVFLVIILSSMISLSFAFVSASLRVGGIGYSDAVLNIAGRSVLSGYDTHLKEEYGLLAFRGLGPEIAQRVEHFASYTFDSNKYLELGDVTANSGGMSLADVDAFEDEVVKYSKYAIARGMIPGEGEEAAEGANEGMALSNEERYRTLRNKAVIGSLPSGGEPGNGNIISSVKGAVTSPGGAFSAGTSNYFVVRYIMMEFGNAQSGSDRDTFFVNEAEYILEGEMSDEANLKAFKKDIIEARNASNLIYIWLDPEMREKVIAVSEAATPGPWSALTAAAISEAWALAESMNDLKLLEHGKKVPVQKTKETWAVDIESLFNKENAEAKYIDTGSKTGLTYTGYLRLFLFFEERSLRLMRMMDLMQINIQGKYDRDFLIMEHNLGFWFKAEVDGREYAYEEKY